MTDHNFTYLGTPTEEINISLSTVTQETISVAKNSTTAMLGFSPVYPGTYTLFNKTLGQSTKEFVLNATGGETYVDLPKAADYYTDNNHKPLVYKNKTLMPVADFPGARNWGYDGVCLFAPSRAYGGPAGLQAATHAARAKAEVAALGRIHRSSLYKAHVENYCCMDATLSGMDILEQGKHQAEKFGARFFEQDVLSLDREESGRFVIHLEDGQLLAGWSLILAMGVSRNRLHVPGEKELLGKGVSYCVDCDGNFFREEVVVVAGSESAACSGALSLLLIARELGASALVICENKCKEKTKCHHQPT
jgi:hypothetical protein